MKTAIIVTSTEAGSTKKRKRSFSDINPNATNEELKDFAIAVNGLTTNTYVETNRVDTTNVDTENSRKSFRNITITGATQGASATITVKITSGTNVNPAVFYYSNNNVQVLSTTKESSTDPTKAVLSVTIPNSSGTIFIGLAANEQFYADFIDATVE